MNPEQLDRNQGHWVLHCPYDLAATLPESEEPSAKRRRNSSSTESQPGLVVQRTYFCDLNAVVSQGKQRNDPAFQSDSTRATTFPSKTYYRDGRHFYFVSSLDYSDVFLSRPNSLVQPVTPDADKRRDTFPFNPLFKLICTGFRMADVIPFLRQPGYDQCTDYGSRIARSIIKIAATRIFAEPEQSIVELPVNSIDSYTALRAGTGTIGKFGMGFFSILYWLVDFPERSLTIESYHNGCRLHCTISEKEWTPGSRELGFTLDFEDTNVLQDGTYIVLNCGAKPFTDHNVEAFKAQLGKLRYITTDLIAFRETTDAMYSPWNQPRDTTNKVFVQVNHSGIIVEDYAQGISLQTLLQKLFVPSVSTKGIQTGIDLGSQEDSKEEAATPSRIVPSGQPQNTFVILVQNVAIVTLPFESDTAQKYDVVMHMSSKVRIPVSRDDILVQEHTYVELLYHHATLLEQCRAIQNIAVLQLAFQAYVQYTTLLENRQRFTELLNRTKLPDLVNVQELYVGLLSAVPLVASRIASAISTDQYNLISLLDSLLERDATLFDSTVFWNKKVFYVEPERLKGELLSSAGLSSYLFVNRHFVMNHSDSWKQQLAVTSYTDRLLVLDSMSEFVSIEIDDKYKGFIESRLRSMVRPGGSDRNTDIMFVNISCQIALKFLSLFDIYNVYEMSHIDSIFKRVLPSRTSPFFYMSAAGNYWYSEPQDTVSVADKFLFSILDDLLFLFELLGSTAVYHLFSLYDVLNEKIAAISSCTYGSGKPLIYFCRLLFAFFDRGSGPYDLNELKKCNIPSERPSVLFQEFPVLRSYLKEHAELSIEAANFKVDSFQRHFVFWSEFNPYSCMNRALYFYKKKKESPWFYNCGMALEIIVMYHFICYYIKTEPSYPLFFIIVVLLLPPLDLSKLVPQNLFQPDNRNFDQQYAHMYDVVFPELIRFLHQFVMNNISDLPELVKRLMQIYHPFLLDSVPEFNLLKQKLKVGFELFLNILKGTGFALPRFDLRDNRPSIPEQHVVSNRFTTSRLIDYILKQNETDSLFTRVTQYVPSTQVPLQLTEIAINEGSTKTFTEAMLIETVQNSVDAIRLNSPLANTSIRLSLKENDTLYMFKISDFVGISSQNLLSLMIPFLSSKVASASVTGEMGSGFFNLYRNSVEVVIHTTRDRQTTFIVDIPIKNPDGRVIDLDKQVFEFPEDRDNQTDIYVYFEKQRDLPFTTIIDMIHFIKNTVAVIPTFVPEITLFFNDEPLNVSTELVLDTPMFTSYFCIGSQLESYIFTKSVPFLPLEKFVVNANLFPNFFMNHLGENILVNVHQGVYTPVQTRGKINILPESKTNLTHFLTNTVYLVALKNLETLCKNSIYPEQTNDYLDNFTSTASLNQLLPRPLDQNITAQNAFNFQQFMMHYKYHGADNFETLINKSYRIMGNRRWKWLRENQRLQIEQLTPIPLQSLVLVSWLENKNDTENTRLQKTEKPYVNPLDTRLRDLLSIFVDTFVKEFWRCGRDLQLPGKFALVDAPQVQILEMDEGTKGSYTDYNHTLSLNETMLMTDEQGGEPTRQFAQWLLTVQTPNDVSRLYENPIFDNFFKCTMPARTVIHELEHARQVNSDHNLQGAHDNVMLQLPGSANKLYSFDSAAVAVYQYIASRSTPSLWFRVIERVKGFVAGM